MFKEADITGSNEKYSPVTPEKAVDFISPTFKRLISISGILDAEPDSKGKRYATLTRIVQQRFGLMPEESEVEETLRIELKDIQRAAEWTLGRANEEMYKNNVWSRNREFSRFSSAGVFLNDLIIHKQIPKPKEIRLKSGQYQLLVDMAD